MRFVLDSLYLLAAVALSPMLLYRVIRHQRYRQGWAHRFGFVSRHTPESPCIWIHGVSVGEINAAKTIVAKLRETLPDHEIIISATTDTGFARARTLYGDHYTVFYFPLDLSGCVRRAFDALKPRICLLMELEVWPNFMRQAHYRRIPVIVLNGRISDKSFSAYQRVRPLFARTFHQLHGVLAQTQEYARRFEVLGCRLERIQVTGSLKYDTAQVTDKVKDSDALAARLDLGTAPLWVAGGTGPDEEKTILEIFKKLKDNPIHASLRLAIVPRKPERFSRVAGWITDAGFPLVRYSQLKQQTSAPNPSAQAVILGDTMGDLRKFYSLATVVFVGRSLVPMGGSDMMEVTALGKPTVFGPFTYNFQQTVEALLAAGGALQVSNAGELYETIHRLLTDRDYANGLGERGRRVIIDNQGATQRSVALIEKSLAQTSLP